MLGLIQLVSHAHVKIADHEVSMIEKGILALIGIEKSDTQQEAIKLLEKITQYRIFPDATGKMNLSLQNIQGSLLLVPQFTLVAETNKGTRPGFSQGMPPEKGKQLFEFMVNYGKEHYSNIQSGQFGAHMQISLCNDGPVTFLLKV